MKDQRHQNPPRSGDNDDNAGFPCSRLFDLWRDLCAPAIVSCQPVMRFFSQSLGRGSELFREAKPVDRFVTPDSNSPTLPISFTFHHTDISIDMNMTIIPPSHLVLEILKVLRFTEHTLCYPIIEDSSWNSGWARSLRYTKFSWQRLRRSVTSFNAYYI